MAVAHGIAPPAPRRQTAVSEASLSAASLAAEEARLELIEAENQLVEAEAGRLAETIRLKK